MIIYLLRLVLIFYKLFPGSYFSDKT